MSRSRKYVFTINNYTDDDIARLSNMGTLYLCYGKETGENGTPHLQGFLYYKNSKSFNAIKKNLPRAHLEIAKGSVAQNVEYCSKDGDFTELGKRPRKYEINNLSRYSPDWSRWKEMYSGRTRGAQQETIIEFSPRLSRSG